MKVPLGPRELIHFVVMPSRPRPTTVVFALTTGLAALLLCVLAAIPPAKGPGDTGGGFILLPVLFLLICLAPFVLVSGSVVAGRAAPARPVRLVMLGVLGFLLAAELTCLGFLVRHMISSAREYATTLAEQFDVLTISLGGLLLLSIPCTAWPLWRAVSGVRTPAA